MFDTLMNGAVTKENLAICESVKEENIRQEAIREELWRIQKSPMFIQSGGLSRILRFTVEATVGGEAEMLKEYLVGTEVSERKPPYHPNMDSLVRREARKLRRKLKKYCESVGKDDRFFQNGNRYAKSFQGL